MEALLLTMPEGAACARGLQRLLGWELGMVALHRFPDGETCPSLPCDVAGRDVVLVGALNDPDPRLVALYLSASIARELGALSVGLVLPYLPYMRQDARFAPGQGITSVHFARLLSACCDWLVTVDPHLHRHSALDQLYAVPTRVVHAAPAIAAWIAEQVERPLVIGPDGESAQWAGQVAALAGCPVTVLHKTRGGDREVTVSAVGAQWAGHTPVLVDDIVSTAGTMIAATGQLAAAGMRAPVCIAVHALFAPGAAAALASAGAARVVSCNTVSHASNGIDLAPGLACAVREMLAQGRR
ncbi:MAG: ribose-phosphate diphosphokinase [Pseudomonadota bacterium]